MQPPTTPVMIPAMKTPILLAATLLLSACGSLDFIGLGGSPTPEAARTPQNATQYRCAANTGFWLRNLEGGALWLILPERELRLEPLKGEANRYAAGRVRLELDGDAAQLFDPPGSFNDCKKAPTKS